MSKRNNKVWIEGELFVENIDTTELDGHNVPSVQGLICTAPLEMGGHHRFVAYGRLAVETIGFLQAVRGDGPAQALIVGWLRSMPLSNSVNKTVVSVVVADNITFIVSKEVRLQAREFINKALQGQTDLGEIRQRVRKDLQETSSGLPSLSWL